MAASGDTLLRLLRKLPPTSFTTPRVLGVDDWAIRRGQRYGTILCDLERHCVVDLLPERSARSFADWLNSHPGIEVISRDRGDIYIRGAKEAAPQAVQVTDRWHLIKNLSDTLIRILGQHVADIQSAVKAVVESESADHAHQHVRESDPETKKQDRNARLQLVEHHRESRLQTYKEIREMRQSGLSLRAIARKSGMHRSTIRRYAEAVRFPERQSRRYTRGTDSFESFLRRRWGEGCRNAKQLTRELAGQGFKGSYYMVLRCVRGWRQSGNHELHPAALAIDVPGLRGLGQPTATRGHRVSASRK